MLSTMGGAAWTSAAVATPSKRRPEGSFGPVSYGATPGSNISAAAVEPPKTGFCSPPATSTVPSPSRTEGASTWNSLMLAVVTQTPEVGM